ncbi:MAG: hypothetical protein QNJ81_12950 [Acidimicrobiia bacterium]|nr:hypothetical protein [Acidimicrobiia bacterium]
MTESPEDILLPLRDRFPDYLATFGILWAAIVATGLVIGVFTAASLVEGVAYVALATGIALMLAGGASGGGYTSLGMGAAGAIFGSRQRHDDEFDDAEVRRGRLKRVSAQDRLRRGLRPEKNPRAFWQVIAGFINLAASMGLLMAFGS